MFSSSEPANSIGSVAIPSAALTTLAPKPLATSPTAEISSSANSAPRSTSGFSFKYFWAVFLAAS